MEKLYTTDITKRNISEALLELMRKKDFHTISITEIAEEASVGRATFYRSFKSKEEVLKYYFDIVVRRFRIPTHFIPHTDKGYYDTVLFILGAVKKNKRLIQRVLNANLGSTILEYLNAQYIRLFSETGKLTNELVPYLYAGAVYNLARKWIEDDCRMPVEEVAEAIICASFGKGTPATI